MNWQANAVSRRRLAEREFLDGERQMRNGNWAGALAHFSAAVRNSARDDPMKNIYVSYEGLALVHANDRRGILLCRRAAADEIGHGDVFRNLARAELRLKNRKRACDAIQRGLSVDSGHAGLRALRQRMGVRRAPVIPFLSRDHILNRLIGQLTYRRDRARAAGSRPVI
jgi:hypothetical protein